MMVRDWNTERGVFMQIRVFCYGGYETWPSLTHSTRNTSVWSDFYSPCEGGGGSQPSLKEYLCWVKVDYFVTW